VWNRRRYIKHPEAGKRIARLNPRSGWTITDVPELRIIDDALWQAVKARQASTRHIMQAGIVRARRRKYLYAQRLAAGISSRLRTGASGHRKFLD
jgi:site-specific DNA recombinase